jgi:Tol biopolymer transport system component
MLTSTAPFYLSRETAAPRRSRLQIASILCDDELLPPLLCSYTDMQELQVVDFATRQTETVPESENLAMSRWSYDGRFIAATRADQSQLKLWDVGRRQWRVITRGKALGISVWSPDSRYLYFQDLLGKEEEVWRYNIRLERVEPVVEFSRILKSGVGRCALFGVTPDGSPVIAFDRGTYDLFTASVTLP